MGRPGSFSVRLRFFNRLLGTFGGDSRSRLRRTLLVGRMHPETMSATNPTTGDTRHTGQDLCVRLHVGSQKGFEPAVFRD